MLIFIGALLGAIFGGFSGLVIGGLLGYFAGFAVRQFIVGSLQVAQSSVGADKHGFREEFIELVSIAKMLHATSEN